jgi:hypothetical protein
VDAIRSADTEPEKPVELQVVPGWEAVWEERRRLLEDRSERERRYGRLYSLQEIHGGFVLRVELPRTLPSQELLCMYGFSLDAPEYECGVLLMPPDTASVRARLQDPRLRLLGGKLNSFPSGFRLDYRFPRPVSAVFRRLDAHDLWVYGLPEAVADPRAALSELVREHLAAKP